MDTTLRQRLDETRRRLRRVVVVHGAALTAAVAAAVVVAAGMADWIFHVSPGMRVVFLAGLFLSSGWLAWRWLARPLAEPIRDLDLALRLERLRPELGERLSSTVDFLRHRADDQLV
ncbi:MAG: hypothetical protein ACRC1K_01970, partial [Planctomycetia bacterium]